MIIDCILDRKDGVPYRPEKFYRDIFGYGEISFDITAAMDYGTENDVRNALCEYVLQNDYNPAICGYIHSVKWL